MSNNIINNKAGTILLVGAGYMAKEYAKVLLAQKKKFIVVGRGEESAKKFKEEIGIDVIKGGIENYINNIKETEIPKCAIVAVRATQLNNTAALLINKGVKNLLLEKPGAMNSEEIKKLKEIADIKSARVVIAYNRRFYSSVLEAQKRILDDGGVTSFCFEFTEWASSITKIPDKKERERILWGNSAHVIDMAFHLGGKPKQWTCYSVGKDKLEWHPIASSFSGAGISELNATFSYQANHNAPGRWGVEVMTEKHRYIFRPLEKLQIQDIGSVKIEFVEIDDQLDLDFKPGLYREVEAFFEQDYSNKNLCTLDEQVANFELFDKIAGVN